MESLAYSFTLSKLPNGQFIEEPLIFATIDHGREIVPLIVDSGAAKTLIPLSWAGRLGHDNKHRLVRKDIIHGASENRATLPNCFIHTGLMSFLGEDGNETWTTPKHVELRFTPLVEKFGAGLLGRDILFHECSGLTFDTESKYPEDWTFRILH